MQQDDSHLAPLWARLRKFQMLSTGVLSLDAQIRAALGDWLSASEERAAILRESKIQEISITELLSTLGTRQARPDNLNTIKPAWTLVGKRLYMCVPPVTDSGQYRIYRRVGEFVVIDEITRKRVNNFKDTNGLERFLKFWFSASDVNLIILDMID